MHQNPAGLSGGTNQLLFCNISVVLKASKIEKNMKILSPWNDEIHLNFRSKG